MNTSRAILLYMALGLIFSCSTKKESTPAPATNPGTGGTSPVVPAKEYTFESTAYWSEEFDGDKVDTSKWGYETGASGWGNHELEYYTPGNNAAITNGNLVITAKKEAWPGASYSSARLFSKGSGNFTYGRIEIKAKLPAGKGTWPAIWMLPTDNAYGNWPASGEMDIMEHVGYDPANVYVTFHTGAYNSPMKTQKGTTVNLPTSTSEFHLYRIDWTPAAITAFIDDQQVYQFKNEGTGSSVWPFDKRFHLMLNVAVGGDWGGAQGIDDTAFPTAMMIDYIHVYRVSNL